MSESKELPPLVLREAVNVPHLKERDKLVRRMKRLRARVVLDRDSLLHWNRTHPDEQPLDTTFEDRVIDWCDGKGPMPTEVPE